MELSTAGHFAQLSALTQADPDAAAAGVIERLRDGKASITSLVDSLGSMLSSDDASRVRGIVLLAQVVEAAPESLRGPADALLLADFFSARLADWPSTKGALRGCVALMRRGSSGRAPLDGAAATQVMQRFADSVRVQSLVQSERALSYDLLLLALEDHGAEVLEGGVDLLEAVVASAQGEQDPRCLLLVFRAVRSLVRLLSGDSPHHAARLEEGAHDLYEDVLSCYFPLVFSPRPGDPDAVSRDALAEALLAALTATPAFAPMFLPLALEKLTSTLKQAKLDALSGLAAAADAYGAEAMAQHWPGVCRALRREVLAAAAPSLEGGSRDAELADAATRCLRLCVAANSRYGRDDITKQLMLDSLLDDLIGSMTSGADDAGAAAAQAHAIGSILAAVAAGSPAGCDAIFAATVPRLLPLVRAPETAAAERLASEVLLTLVTGVREGLPAMPPPADPTWRPFEAVAGELLAAAAHDGPKAAQPDSSSGPVTDAFSARSPVRLSLLGELLSFPPERQPLDEDQLRHGLQRLTAVVGQADDDSSAAAAIAAALTMVAGAGHGELVAQLVVPQLLAWALASVADPAGQAAHQPASRQLAALAALSDLATATGATRLPVLQALCDRALLGHLTQQAAGPRTPAAGITLQRVCDALTATVLPASDMTSDPQLGCIAQLPGSLIDSSLQVSGSMTPDELLSAAVAAHQATRMCPASVQTSAAEAAAAALSTGAPAHRGASPKAPPDVVLAAAVLAGLRPEAIATVSTASSLAAACLGAALRASDLRCMRLCFVAAAAIANKAGGPAGEECISVLLSAVIAAVSAEQTCRDGLVALGWLTRGLAMRGHECTQDCLRKLPPAEELEQRVLSLLQVEQLIMGTPAADEAPQKLSLSEADNPSVIATTLLSGPGHEESMAAAQVYATVLADDGDEDVITLSRGSHAVTRILWQQRFFEQAMEPLRKALQLGQREGLPAPPAVLVGLASLVTAAPPAVAKPHVAKLLPWLVQALAALQMAPLPDTTRQSVTLLGIITASQSDDAGRQAQESQLDKTLALLLQLARDSPAMEVRRAALLSLGTAMLDMPAARLAAHKGDVIKCLNAAVDDRKRNVRQVAVQCRQAWSIV